MIENMTEMIIKDFGSVHLMSVSALYRAQAQHTSVGLTHWEDLYLSIMASKRMSTSTSTSASLQRRYDNSTEFLHQLITRLNNQRERVVSEQKSVKAPGRSLTSQT